MSKLSSLQQLHYASDRYALLLIFQGMDGCREGRRHPARHVRASTRQGCEVFSFKQPSAEELEHDFLWRTDAATFPNADGSACSTVPITRKCWWFACIRRFSGARDYRRNYATKKTIWEDRYRSIVDLEGTFTVTARRPSKYSSIFPTRISAAIPRPHR